MSGTTPKMEIVWMNVTLFCLYHIAALNGIYYFLTLQIHWKTFLWGKLRLSFKNNCGQQI
jgi:hypothetical protein